jgi:hypothetical protein
MAVSVSMINMKGGVGKTTPRDSNRLARGEAT